MVAMLTITAFAFPASAQEAGSRAATPKVSGKPVKKPQPRKPAKTHASFLGTDTAPYQNSLGMPLVRHLLSDQESIWTSPLRIRMPQATWLVPLGGLTAGLFATDTEFSRHLNNSPATLSHYGDFSNYGIGSMVGVGAGLYLWGLTTHDEHKRETGFLAGEAAIDSVAAATAIKYMTWRERPFTDNANGQFWDGGDSFPSDHAAVAWSVAGVIAHEYPGPLTKVFAYGLASAISVSRVKAKQHFPSDVLVGSALGWLIGQYVYSKHHSPELNGGAWDFPRMRSWERSESQPQNMGSPYVPLDSWVYPAFERLAALGYIHSDFEGMRPWTRLECARLVDEASDNISANETNGAEATRLYDALEKEFAREINLLGGGSNRQIRLESVYTRATAISGQPLTDGYHFGQTIINDYGRPYEEGFNNVTGFSGWATAGPFVGYLRGEYQHAPSSPALPASARQVIQQVDGLPAEPPSTPTPAVDRFDPVEAYVGMNFDNWQITFGKQSLWWGPDQGGAMIFSNNAEPVKMIKIDRVSPFKLPSVLGVFGPFRADFLLGQLGGHHFVNGPSGITGTFSSLVNPQPFLEEEKFSFKPTPNVEFGFTGSRIFAGAGVPFTIHKLLQALFSQGNGPPGSASDPGDWRSEFDFSYRLPGLRKWATVYGDGFSEDEPSPIAYAQDSAWTGGIYLPQIPKIPKLDFRAEGVFTDTPRHQDSTGFFYFNVRYLNGYTNLGNIMGSWIGRQGQGAQAWATYWFSPKDKLQFNFRHQKVSQQFIPDGGTLTDGGIRADFWVGREFSVASSVQYEKWDFPVLRPGPTSDFTTSVQFTCWPHLRLH